jgi:Kdo2-lipid IVA lauroyltransferase/acyltransferase
MVFVFRLFSHLPLPLLHNLGALFGWLTWLASPTYRRHFRENIELAGLGEARQAAIAEAGKAIAELPKIWLRPSAELVDRVVQVTGWERVEAARAAGHGIVYLTPHLGCFEITAQYLAARPGADGSAHPITVLYRKPRQAWLAPLMELGRGTNLKLAPADLGGVRRLMKALKQGEATGMLPDQVPGNGEGIWAPFFGRPAYTMTLVARLIESGATVLFTYAERLHYGAGYHIHFLPLSRPLTGDLPARVAQLNGEVEAIIRRCPEQYLWGYNRYKRPAGAPEPK